MTYFRTEVLQYLERGWDKYNLDNPRKYSSDSFLIEILNSLDKSKTISDDDYIFDDLIKHVKYHLKQINTFDDKKNKLCNAESPEEIIKNNIYEKTNTS